MFANWSNFLIVLMNMLMISADGFASTEVFYPVLPEQVPSGLEYKAIQPQVENAQLFAGKSIGILVANGVEESEITFPYEYLKKRGAQVDIIVPSWSKEGVVAVRYLKPTLWIKADATFANAANKNYDLLVLTGGAWNAQVVRSDADAIHLVKHHFASHKPIAAICAGSSILIDAGLAKGRSLTGSPVVAIDLKNAGAQYVNQALVLSENMVTSRSPDDLESFVQGLKILLTADSNQ